MEADLGLLNECIQKNLDIDAGHNSPSFEPPTQRNYEAYFHGVVSRMSGLINSCPSTKPLMFNFPKNHLKFGLEDILNSLPFEDGPPLDEVKERFLELGLAGEEKVTLHENSLELPVGLTPLEKDIFGGKLVRESQITISLGRSSTLPDKRMDRANSESVLSPLEMLQYDKSVSTNPVKLKELSEAAAARAAQKRKNPVEASNPGTSATRPSDSEVESSDLTPSTSQVNQKKTSPEKTISPTGPVWLQGTPWLRHRSKLLILLMLDLPQVRPPDRRPRSRG